jgi:lipopolysaccharide/colanic/teichoic acid biosynthesis glycosyltransferase
VTKLSQVVQDNPVSPIASHDSGAGHPTLWGLTPSQLHDRFWAARGVQVVRHGEPSEIVADAELYMLTDARTLAIFRIASVVETLSWLRPDVLFVRVHETQEHGYREEAVSDAQGRLVRFNRVYGGSDSQLARVVLTPDKEIARIWQTVPTSRSGWRKLRKMVPRRFRAAASIRGSFFDRGSDSEVVQFIRELVRLWNRPDATIARPTRLASAWTDPTADVGPSTRCVGPVWIGAGRKLPPDTTVVGPAALWDDPASRPVVEDLHWLAIEPVEAVLARPVRTRQRSPLARATKRFFDVTFASAVLLATSPIFPIVMLAISIEDGRPWFFGHMRETLGGREFPCWKFRSMRKDSEQIKAKLMALNKSDGPQFFIDPDKDPRLTRVGKLARKLNIDELPQLWNVIKGDMSIVGPRPSPFKENQYCPPWREARLSVRPGITGLWQVKRSRLPGLDFQEWIKYDLEYVAKSSWALDLKILVETVRVILRGAIH